MNHRDRQMLQVLIESARDQVRELHTDVEPVALLDKLNAALRIVAGDPPADLKADQLGLGSLPWTYEALEREQGDGWTFERWPDQGRPSGIIRFAPGTTIDQMAEVRQMLQAAGQPTRSVLQSAEPLSAGAVEALKQRFLDPAYRSAPVIDPEHEWVGQQPARQPYQPEPGLFDTWAEWVRKHARRIGRGPT